MANYQQNQMGYQQMSPPVQYQYYPNNLNMNMPYDNTVLNNNASNNLRNNQQYFLKCRPVASREEAMASQIDLDGSLWIFTDVSNGKIYTKQINNDGTASFNTYAYVKEQNPYKNLNSSNFVTKDEFDRVIQNLMAAIGNNTTGSDPASNNQTTQSPVQF